MRLGLIARSEIARGIALQSLNFYQHMPVERVLLVRMPRPDCEERPEWYANRTEVAYDATNHRLDEATVREWLEGLDVVFTVETPNDWRMPLWCREMGVKLIVQGNPEFVKHVNDGTLPHPDAWWWPTSWRCGFLPRGPVVPVPMPVRPIHARPDRKLHLVHVVGKRAYADRNGSDLMLQIMRQVHSDVKLTVYGIDGQLPEFRRQRNVEFEMHPDGVVDRWEMYENADVLVLPRRYGGLCLPALEAAASGCAVIMPECSPNEELAAVVARVQSWTPLNVACGPIRIANVDTSAFAEEIDKLAAPSTLEHVKMMQSRFVRHWTEMRQEYLNKMEAVL